MSPRRHLRPLGLLLVALVLLVGVALAFERAPLSSGGAPVAGPAFAPPPGRYEGDVHLQLRPAERGEIVFTTQGAIPSLTVGTVYERPLHLDADHPGVLPLRALEVVGGHPGPVHTASYAVGLEGDLPILSLVMEPSELWDAERGLFVRPWERGQAWERPVHVSLLLPEGEVAFALDAGLRVHNSEPFDAPKQSLRLYFRREYGQPRLEFPLFESHPQQAAAEQSYKRLLLQAGDRAGRWLLFRDQLVAGVLQELGLPVAQGRFVHLFINGDAWGIYRLSERVDRFYLEDNYGIEDGDLVQDGRQREGSDEGWDALADWVKVHDLADPVNMEYFESRVDLENFTDFALLYLYFGFSGEDLYAVQPPGGRWSFIYGGGSRHFAQRADASLEDLLEAESDFALFLRKALANPLYRRRFVERAADLLNLSLAPETIQGRVERWAATLEDDIGYETLRWSAPLPWSSSVEMLSDFVEVRPGIVREQLVDSLRLDGLSTLGISSSPSGVGALYVNGWPIEGEEWRGHFFAGTAPQLIAVPTAGYRFVRWEDADNNRALGPSPEISLPLTTTSQRVEAIFATSLGVEGNVRPEDVLINEYWINDNGTPYASLDNRAIEGDWVELLVRRDGVDLRGWRLTDNDTLVGTGEGSLILPRLELLSAVPEGTTLLLIASETSANALSFPEDDLDPSDRRLLFYVGNGTVDRTTDPGFGIGVRNDNLVLLAPGPSPAFEDDIGVDFVAEGRDVTPYSFGVLGDGVRFDAPFQGLGRDDGVFLHSNSGNDRLEAWTVDPSAYESGDAFRLDTVNRLTPGAPNPGQRSFSSGFPWLVIAVVVVVASVMIVRRRGF